MKKHLSIYLCACVLLCACAKKSEPVVLTILHTNDTHSQVEPKADGTGGYARRMGLIAAERQADPELLLLDAGDFSQGTPYFNFYHGRVEVDAMNRMGYDAATLGNHEFDNGLDTLAVILRLAHFPVVCANYDVTGTPLEGLVKPYTVLERKGVKIGVTGLGVTPDDLISQKNFAPIRYQNPLPVLEEVSRQLREKEHCDLVVCLSHLGTDNGDTGVSDTLMAPLTHGVDVFIGGHTHHVYDGKRMRNADSCEVVLSQMGKSGARLGKMLLRLE